jgi:hypothetical protein
MAKSKNNKQLENIAKDVLKKANIPEDQNFGSIIAILMVISIILTVIRVLQECNKNKTLNMTSKEVGGLYGAEIRSYSLKRGWFTRLRIKRIMRQQLSKEDYHKYAIKLTEVLLDKGETITDGEALTLLEASNV